MVAFAEPDSRQLAVDLPQHPDEYRPEDAILLAVEQQSPRWRDSPGSPELSDPVGPLEVGERQDM